MESVGFIILSIIVGLAVGILAGMLGIGGGTVLVPVFKLGFGLSALASTATSLFTVIPTSVSGVIAHVRNKTCFPKLGVAAGLAGALTSPLGVWLGSISPDWAVMVAAALVIVYSASTSLRKAFQSLKQDKLRRSNGSSGAVEQSMTVPRSSDFGSRELAICAGIGLLAGVLSGYVGVGGGFLIIPLMMQFLNLPMKMTSGTSLVSVMILATSATIMQLFLGNVNWVAGICVSIGSIPGAYLGSKLMKRIPETALRFIFGCFLLVAAALLVIDQF